MECDRKLYGELKEAYETEEHNREQLTDDQLRDIASRRPCVEWELADIIGFTATMDWSDTLLPIVWNHLRQESRTLDALMAKNDSSRYVLNVPIAA